MKTLAERLFDAQTTLMAEDGALETELDRLFPGRWPFENYTYDYYDGSVELRDYHPDCEPTSDQLQGLIDLGFCQGWCVFADGTELSFCRNNKGEVQVGMRHGRRKPEVKSDE